MSTRDNILKHADRLLRDKGYNGFSFKDVADVIGIKTASIHYHFPSKSRLAVSLVQCYLNELQVLKDKFEQFTDLENLDEFFQFYSKLNQKNEVCIVGSLSTELHTLEDAVACQLKDFAQQFLHWVSLTLERGRTNGSFAFSGPSRTKALMIISNMWAMLQLSRLTSKEDFYLVEQAIKEEIIKK